ncbi:HPP-domain-containing protein [Basidiobolus meristosporus CBS 931.73]|uniref:HPP-domain-containing protein n=1 Tax=Basidiobolus meristosporus CBS 931.73 TaxID=1314790 RepID=A0A1Y1X4Z5_9FUNG|nr:HPP-domain-containing protein [Basidiobolus meristosporus CBS 931.73]|eukprot:ORX80887.1 HPP-domain-containing protein [Basidiobolus meristosporus CBS 931.73]
MGFFGTYIGKLKKYERVAFPPMPPYSHLFSSWAATFTGIAITGLLTWNAKIFSHFDGAPVLIGSWGASSVLMYVALDSPLGQPYNALVGGTISAFVGVTIGKIFNAGCSEDMCYLWLQAALAVSLAIVCMMVTRSVHPPGAATALITITAGQHIREVGYFFIISPVLIGTLILIIVAVLFDNVFRKYPRYWMYNWPKSTKELILPAQTPKKPQETQVAMVEGPVPTASDLSAQLEAAHQRIQELEAKLTALEGPA